MSSQRANQPFGKHMRMGQEYADDRHQPKSADEKKGNNVKKRFIGLVVLCALLGACKEEIPDVTDVNNIVVSGTKYSKEEFRNKWCIGTVGSRSCELVVQAIQMEQLYKPGVTNW